MRRAFAVWSPGQWALRMTCVAGILVGLGSTGLAGTWPAGWLVLVVGGLAVAHAAAPEAAIGTVAMAFVLVWWGVAFRDGLHPAAILAAAGLLASHLAGLVASYGPDRMAVDRATVWLWVRRGVGVLALSPLLYVVAAMVRDRPEPVGIWVAGLVAGLVTVVWLAVSFAPGGDER